MTAFMLPLALMGLLLFWAPATPAAPANTGYSLRFLGSGANDIDRVKIPIDPQVPADVGANFTIEFWIKTTTSTGGFCSPGGTGDGWINGHIIVDRDIDNNQGAVQNGDYGISLTNGRICFGVANASSGRTIQGTSNLANGQWHHIAVTRNSSSGQMRIYVNGQQEASATGPTGDISYLNGRTSSAEDDPFLVFAAEKHDYQGVLYYSGLLDDIRISNTVRYTQIFTRPSAPHGADANTVALYRFDEGSGATINDSAPGGASPGFINYGGSPVGPQWSTDTPFGSAPPPPPPPPPDLDPWAYIPFVVR